MTTPKELADKVKQQAQACQEAWHEYEVAFQGDEEDEIVKATNAHNRAETELHATIDLQAMAEARQGSGEPVAWEVRHWNTNGPAWSEWERVQPRNAQTDTVESHLADIQAYIARGLKYELRALNTSPPSAGDRTHIADLIDTFEQLRKIVGTPEQDADALIAAVRALAAPPSAQQATGSGQVLTDLCREIVSLHAQRGCVLTAHVEQMRDILAADAQAQTEGEPVGLLQGGLSNDELTAAWNSKLPGAEPTERHLSAFAVGIEFGFARARELEKADWSRVHYALKDAGVHPGRTDDHIADVIARALATQAQPEVPAGWKLVPVEPTPEMMKAAKGVPEANKPYPPHYFLIWDAMLAAAPTTGKREPLTEEPSADWFDSLIEDIEAISCRYRGDPSYDHDAYYMREQVVQMLTKRRDALGITGEQR